MVVAVVLGVFALAVFSLSWLNKKTKLIPGWSMPPAHPEMGDLNQVLSCGGLPLYLEEQHQGGRCPVSSFWWRKDRVVSVCGPQAFKDTENVYNRPKIMLDRLHGFKSIQAVNDAEWQERKSILHGTLRGRNVESFFHDFVAIARETVKRWGPGGKQIEVKKEMFCMTLKGVLTTTLGKVCDDDVNLLGNLYDACKSEVDSRILDQTPDAQRQVDFQHNLKQLQDYLRQMLESRKQKKNTRPLPFLDALISSKLPEECVISDMTTVLGGFHTSAFYLTWLLHFLAQDPNIQDKLVWEISEKVTEGDSIDTLKAYVSTSDSFLRQVLDEALRLSATAAHTAHYCNHDLMVAGYLVPANTAIIHCMGVTLSDEAIWEEPGSFDPERFAPGSRHANRGREFRPFGVSCQRRCPANHFTYMMVSVYLTILLQHFTFLSVNPEERVEKCYGIATSPKEDIRLQVECRNEE